MDLIEFLLDDKLFLNWCKNTGLLPIYHRLGGNKNQSILVSQDFSIIEKHAHIKTGGKTVFRQISVDSKKVEALEQLKAVVKRYHDKYGNGNEVNFLFTDLLSQEA